MLPPERSLKGAGRQSAHHYRVFDRVLQSAVALPSLAPAAPDDPATLHFALCSEKQEPGEPMHEWRTGEGELTLSATRLPDGGTDLYLPGGGHFYVDRDLAHIACAPDPDADEATIEHLLLDQVVPRVLAQTGQVVLHGSAVALLSGAVIAFVGDTGQGKSTLAAAFTAAGATLLTDDSFMISHTQGQADIVPGYGGLRLWEDTADTYFAGAAFRPMAHYSTKQRLVPRHLQVPESPGRLQALFVLDEPADAGIAISDYTSGADAVMTLTKALFALDIRDAACHRRWLADIESLVRAVSVRRLSYPRDYAQMPAVLAAIGEASGVL